MRRLTLMLSILFILAAGTLRAQPPGEDPVAQNLFPPELVMRYQQDIGLDEAQGRAIKEAIQKAQAKFLDFQWEMQ